MPDSIPSQTVTFTENAVNKLQNLLTDPNNKDTCLRIYIIGGGCSGFQYGFTLDKSFSENEDIILEPEQDNTRLKVVIDSLSYQYLEGAKIDYMENLQGARFTVENPHAETTCGCGSSFSLKEINE